MDAYIFQADLHCQKCADRIKDSNSQPRDVEDDSNFDSDYWPKGPYPDGGGESDTPQHCGSCGLFLENPLTEDGEIFINDTVELWIEDKQGKYDKEVVQQWVDFYDYLEITL